MISAFYVWNTAMLPSIEQRLAFELAAKPAQVAAAIALLDEGATVNNTGRTARDAETAARTRALLCALKSDEFHNQLQ